MRLKVKNPFSTLLCEHCLRQGWHKVIITAHIPELKSTTSNFFCVFGIISLHIMTGDWRLRVDFGVVRNPAAPIILGTTFIHWFVKGIFPAENKVILYNTKPVPTMMLTMTISKDGQGDNKQKESILLVQSKKVSSQQIQVVRQARLSTISQYAQSVNTEESDLVDASFLPSFSKKCHFKNEDGIIPMANYR